ncbi:hypothetical protein [Fusobacterium ulcerans]|uniref:hypothetical protein n=1 Tax=Fusobacterium ulcerans TaxID=861 RepID=UPI0030A61512
MYKISIPNFDEGINARIESAQTAFEREEEYQSSLKNTLKNIDSKSEIQINELKLANENLAKTNFNLSVQIEQWKVDLQNQIEKTKSEEKRAIIAEKRALRADIISLLSLLIAVLGVIRTFIDY